jgi:membrane-bound metal-dependent hydrolase YbcI (DUF457 family)
MSGIGHLASGFIGKTAAPQVPLWVLLAASETNDLLYSFFSATGIEKSVAFTFDFNQGMRYMDVGSNPWSHGLWMSVIWATLAGLIGFLCYRDRRPAITIGLVVMSHWGLDFLMHANLPLLLDGSPLVGLGLENSGPGFIFITALDIILLGSAIGFYWLKRKHTAQVTIQPGG